MANHLAGAKAVGGVVRTAVAQDKSDITLLLQNERHAHVHLDWQPPADWIGDKGFMVVPDEDRKPHSLAQTFFGPCCGLAACLAAVADPPPAAWVRVAAVKQAHQTPALLEVMLDAVTAHLQQTAVTELGWLTIKEWPQKWLPDLGFRQANQIVTFVKYDMTIPTPHNPPEIAIRPVQPDDMETLAHIEAAAFEPLWRHSARALRQAHQQAFSFDVAEWNGRVVGFQYSTSKQKNAHLARMTVLPQAQKNGIGSALLAHAIQQYKRHNLHYITLNTQIDNYPSQKLYTKYGFQTQGQPLPIWVKACA
jgi:GNAT superfamily N-acetyltransferase